MLKKTIFIEIFYLIYFSITVFSQTPTPIYCLEPEQCFLDVVKCLGEEQGVIHIIGSETFDFTPVLLKYKDITEPVIKKIIDNPMDYNPRLLGSTCLMASKMGMKDLKEKIYEFTRWENKRVRFLASVSYAGICDLQDQQNLMNLMMIDDPNIKGVVISKIKDRGIFDKSLLIEWRDEQIRLDKSREKKVIPDWFLKILDKKIEELEKNSQ